MTLDTQMTLALLQQLLIALGGYGLFYSSISLLRLQISHNVYLQNHP